MLVSGYFTLAHLHNIIEIEKYHGHYSRSACKPLQCVNFAYSSSGAPAGLNVCNLADADKPEKT